MKIEPEKCSIFLISVGRLLSHEKSFCFVWWLSITNMTGKQTREKVAICTWTVFLAIHHSFLVEIMTFARIIMQQDAAVERVGTRRIQGFLKQFIVNATGNRQIAQKRFLKIRGRKRPKPVWNEKTKNCAEDNDELDVTHGHTTEVKKITRGVAQAIRVNDSKTVMTTTSK